MASSDDGVEIESEEDDALEAVDVDAVTEAEAMDLSATAPESLSASGHMECSGSREEQSDPSSEGERMNSGAVVPAAANQAASLRRAALSQVSHASVYNSEESQVVLTTAQRLAKRAALPKHLRLGVTLAGMRELLSQLPSDAVEQVNAKMEQVNAEMVKLGKEPFPKNVVENGYVNQFHITRSEEEDKLTVCERLQAQGSPHVGEATVFASWFLDTPIATLLDALAHFLTQKGLRDEDTFFWVCDNVIRQTNVKPDLALLGDCVRAIGHTVLLLEPWNDPQPLKRAYCIKEVYHTQVSGATFDMVMSTEQQQAFERALVNTEDGDHDNFFSIEAGLSRVDVRQAECRNAKDKADILDELEKGVGFDKCNALVVGLLREALVAQGQAALGRLPVAERRGNMLLMSMGMLLWNMGKLEEARLLLEEELQANTETMRANRETLGDMHPDTLQSITNTLTSFNMLTNLLERQGKLVESIPLHTEVLEGWVLRYGMEDVMTRHVAELLASTLRKVGQREEAEALADKHGLSKPRLNPCIPRCFLGCWRQ